MHASPDYFKLILVYSWGCNSWWFADITEFLLLIIIIFLDIMPNAKLMPLKLERVYAGLCTITVIVQKVLNNQIVMLLSNFHSSYICKLIEITYHRARTSFD